MSVMSSEMENAKKPKKGPQAPGKKNQAQTPETEKQTYCILCRKMYWKHDAQEHIHSMLHHQELDTVVGTGAFHECHACKVSAMGLNEYGEHILTAQHTTNLENLKSTNVKAVSLHKTLSAETINRILERNKKLKSVEKKAMKKKKKKEKQAAAQQLAGTQQKAANITLPTTSELRKSKQALAEILKQMQEARHAGINMAVVQNKENKESRVDEPFCLPESLLPIEGGTFDHWPGETWNQSSFSYRNMQYNSTQEKDFTDDQLPQSGAIIFGRNTQSPQQESSETSAQSTSSTKPAIDDLFRDVDVSSMLRHIRRVLGVREPCRAEREARQQRNNAAGVSVTQRSVDVSSTPTTSSTPGQPEQASFDGTPEEIPYSGENSGAAVPLSQAVSEHMYKPGKVRIAHKPGKAYLNTEARLRPTLNRLLQLSGARSSLNWSQMWSNIRKKQMKGMNRFGLEMMKHPADQQSSAQAEDSDLPLSEGFHWESLPDSPLDRHLLPPFQGTADVDDPTEEEFDSQMAGHVEQPASAQPSCSSRSGAGVVVKIETGVGGQEYGNNSRTAKRKCNSGTEDGASENISKRKKKKKSNKVSSNSLPGQDQMDQLLTVSLREEELNSTLQDLDSSLFQARGALQAAYAEVQRIVLLKQQCAVEVNSLRARRIEILQNMQEGFSGLSHAPETATASSGVKRPPSLPASDAIPSPSSQPTSAATAPSPVAQLEPSAQALSLKKERCNLPTARLPSHTADAEPLLSASLSDAAQQHTAECSSSANTAPATESSAGQEEQEIREDGGEAFLPEEPQTAQNDDEENMEGNFSMEAAIEDSIFGEESKDNKGNESDNSVEVIHSKTEIIAIEESDYEESSEAKSNIPAGADELQNSVSLELSSVGVQTAQQSDPDKKTELLSFKVEDANSLEESAGEEQPSVGSFLSHAGPVNGLQVHDGLLYTCSGDFTARAYCLVTRECKAVFDGHTNKINCLLVSSLPNMPTRLYTGSSDQTIRAFSIRSQKCLEQISLPDRVLCLHIAWNILYVGLASGSVFSYDLKTLKELDVFDCHGPRGVSCIGTAQEGARRLLLVGSYDSTISVRDAKSGLLLRSLEGHTKTVLCMKVVNDLVFSGSSDTSVHAHNIHTGELVRIYKGHGHAVTAIVILGKVMVTACLDKLVRVFELQSHDRLQVYGGHSDMAMCMAVHKSVIYTGCYDGSVQAVKLNLMKNYRCWWQNCSLIFGMPEHLAQHLTGDHSNPNLQTIKCRWRGCNTFFATQELIKEKLPEHMQKHVENDSSVQP